MPLDFRYHLASLAAVFGALIIGVLLGVAMKEGPVLSNQVQELRKEFQRYDALRDLDQQTDKFNLLTGKPLLSNRLYGRNVALVSNPVAGTTAVNDALRHSLETAGARVVVEIAMKPLLHELTADQIAAIYSQLGIPVASEHEAIGELMLRLGQAVGSGSVVTISALKDARLITVRGDLEKPVSLIIFLGGATTEDDFLEDVDLPFLRGCTERDLQVAATEQLVLSRSVTDRYRKTVPYTVDNIDREAGRIALILALARGKPGHFGFKSSADDVAPRLE